MRFSQIYSSSRPVLSFEFFPPRSPERLSQIQSLISDLARFRPSFMTVTYGANGGARSLSTSLVQYIHRELKLLAVQHLTCITHTVEEIDSIVSDLATKGVQHILALRGDQPKEMPKLDGPSLECARNLVAHLATKTQFSIAVAGYPETHRDAASPEADIQYLKEKVTAGAEVVFTQLFFDNDVYFQFVDRCRSVGISCPIVPGIMPISSREQVTKFTSLCGATIPRTVSDELARLADDADAVSAFGTRHALEQGRGLLRNGAPGVHFYTINRPQQIAEVVQALQTEFQFA